VANTYVLGGRLFRIALRKYGVVCGDVGGRRIDEQVSKIDVEWLWEERMNSVTIIYPHPHPVDLLSLHPRYCPQQALLWTCSLFPLTLTFTFRRQSQDV
jgi:hypothetical protein